MDIISNLSVDCLSIEFVCLINIQRDFRSFHNKVYRAVKKAPRSSPIVLAGTTCLCVVNYHVKQMRYRSHDANSLDVNMHNVSTKWLTRRHLEINAKLFPKFLNTISMYHILHTVLYVVD